MWCSSAITGHLVKRLDPLKLKQEKCFEKTYTLWTTHNCSTPFPSWMCCHCSTQWSTWSFIVHLHGDLLLVKRIPQWWFARNRRAWHRQINTSHQVKFVQLDFIICLPQKPLLERHNPYGTYLFNPLCCSTCNVMRFHVCDYH